MDMHKPAVYYLGSTRNSISVRWDPVLPSSSPLSVAYVVQVEDDGNDWTTKYWGLKNSAVLKGLGPEKVYNVRVGVCVSLGNGAWGDEVWSDVYTFSTKPGLLWTFYLFQYVEKGDAVKIKRFLKERTDCLDTYNRYGETPLLVAIRRKNDAVLRLLLEAGADVHQLAKATSKTPLMAACYNGYRSAVEALTVIGVDWSVTDSNGCQAIHYAVDGGRLDIVSLAIERGADVNARDNFGWTPLMRAVLTGADETVVNLLLENGADTTIRDVNKMTALELAQLMKDDKLADLLRSAEKGPTLLDVESVEMDNTESGQSELKGTVIVGGNDQGDTTEQTVTSCDAFGELNEGVEEIDDDANGDDDDEGDNAIKALVQELAQIAMSDGNTSHNTIL